MGAQQKQKLKCLLFSFVNWRQQCNEMNIKSRRKRFRFLESMGYCVFITRPKTFFSHFFQKISNFFRKFSFFSKISKKIQKFSENFQFFLQKCVKLGFKIHFDVERWALSPFVEVDWLIDWSWLVWHFCIFVDFIFWCLEACTAPCFFRFMNFLWLKFYRMKNFQTSQNWRGNLLTSSKMARSPLMCLAFPREAYFA